MNFFDENQIPSSSRITQSPLIGDLVLRAMVGSHSSISNCFFPNSVASRATPTCVVTKGIDPMSSALDLGGEGEVHQVASYSLVDGGGGAAHREVEAEWKGNTSGS